MRKMDAQTRILQIARKKRLFRLSEAKQAGIHPEAVRRLTSRGQLDRIGIDRISGLNR